MRIYAYLRVSTSEQAANGCLATQRQQISGYAMMRGWEVSEFFVDGGVSGSVPLAERPEGKRLLEAVEKGDTIVTARLDRAFRSAVDALGTLRLVATGLSKGTQPIGQDAAARAHHGTFAGEGQPAAPAITLSDRSHWTKVYFVC